MRYTILPVALAAAIPTLVASAADAPPAPFDTATIRVERNATDGDTEIVIEAVAGDAGVCHFTLIAPGGRELFHFNAFDRSSGGLREFLLESPEPPGDAILASYPEGRYRFRARSCEDEPFRGSAQLSHDLPAATVIIAPRADSEVDVGNGLVVDWSSVSGVSEYILELENESAEPEQSLTLNVAPGTTRFFIPRRWLARGAEYQLGVAAVAENGNVVFTEIEFSTQQ